jgi:FixJ family two-component response regulator
MGNGMTSLPKVFIVDEEPSVVESVCQLVSSAGYPSEGFLSAAHLLQELEHRTPACVITDFNMDGINGLELQEQLAQKWWFIPVIFLTGCGTVPIIVQAMKKGAVDFLIKPVEARSLLSAIGEAIRRGDQIRQLGDQFQNIRKRLSRLTGREQQVFDLVTTGMLNKQVAASLGLSEKTIKVHRGRLMKKLGVQSFAELVRMSEKVRAVQVARP